MTEVVDTVLQDMKDRRTALLSQGVSEAWVQEMSGKPYLRWSRQT